MGEKTEKKNTKKKSRKERKRNTKENSNCGENSQNKAVVAVTYHADNKPMHRWDVRNAG